MAKRRTFSPELKHQMVLDVLIGSRTNSQLCREHQRAPLAISDCKEQFLERAPEVFATPKSRGADLLDVGNTELPSVLRPL